MKVAQTASVVASAVANHNYSKPATNQAVKQTNVPKIETQRVGRWMSTDEYNKMVKTGTVQMSGQNKTHVTNPADIKSYTAAPKGSVFVEFDVPVSMLAHFYDESGYRQVDFLLHFLGGEVDELEIFDVAGYDIEDYIQIPLNNIDYMIAKEAKLDGLSLYK